MSEIQLGWSSHREQFYTMHVIKKDILNALLKTVSTLAFLMFVEYHI